MSAEEHEFLANCEEYSEYIKLVQFIYISSITFVFKMTYHIIKRASFFFCCSGDFDPDDLYNPEPEMDEEIRTAFRAFVQLSKQ